MHKPLIHSGAFFMLLCKTFFHFQKFAFEFYLLSVTLAVVASECAVGCNYAVAGDLWGKGVAFEGLAYSLRASAANTSGKLSVGDCFTGRYIEQLKVYPLLEWGNC